MMSWENDRTIAYYNAQGESYYARTVGVDMAANRDRFLGLVQPGGRIMDLGAGSGRDLAVFRQRGFAAEGLEASEVLCRLAGQHAGVRVVCQRLQDWQGEQLYDGIWANAVLLHLTKGECRKFLGRVGDCLAPEGIFYFSLKCGIVTGMDGEGRYFANYSPQEIRQLVQGSGLSLLELWESGDQLQWQGFCWVNVLAKK